MVKRNENNNLVKFGNFNISLNENGGINASLDVKVGDKTNLTVYHKDFTTPLGNNITSTGVKARYQIYDNGSRDLSVSGSFDPEYVASSNVNNGNSFDFYTSSDLGNGITFAAAEGAIVEGLTFDWSINEYGFSGGQSNFTTLNLGFDGSVGNITYSVEAGRSELESGDTKNNTAASVIYTSPVVDDLTFSASTARRSNDTNYDSRTYKVDVSNEQIGVKYVMGKEESYGDEAETSTFGVSYKMNSVDLSVSRATDDDDSSNYIGIKYTIPSGLTLTSADLADVENDSGTENTTIVGAGLGF